MELWLYWKMMSDVNWASQMDWRVDLEEYGAKGFAKNDVKSDARNGERNGVNRTEVHQEVLREEGDRNDAS